MPVILLVEQDDGVVTRLRQSLGEDGQWRVRHVRSVRAAMEGLASEAPDLFVVSTEVTGASSLLGPFARRQGGPGTLALLPAGSSRSSESAVEAGLGADSVLAKPVTGEQVLEAGRTLLGLGEQGVEARTDDPPEDEPKLTSNDIFGDLVAEVEGEEALRRKRGEPTVDDREGGGRGGEGADRARPPAGSERPPAPPRRLRSDEDIERRLEQTLSGVFAGSRGGRRARAEKPRGEGDTSTESRRRAKRPAGGKDVDALLSETLSGLELPKRKRSAPPPIASARPAQEEPPPPPEEPSEPVPTGLASGATTPSPDRSGEVDEEPPAIGEPAADPGEELLAQSPEDVADEESTAEGPSIPPIPYQPQFADTLEEAPEPVSEVGAAREAPVEGGEIPPSPPPAAEAPPAPEHAAPAPPAEPGEDGQGLPFGQYRLLERIGVGGMAEVWKARMTGMEGFQKTVAIKKILPHLTDSSDFVDMFIDEAKLAAQLNHAHIIHIYDLGRIEGDYYIAMEYVEGENLRAILNAARERGRPLPVGVALFIAARLASALGYAHTKRDFEDRSLELVHRDVSPQNVLIGYEGTIKLCDFGIVKAVSKSSNTRMGALKGKLQYMSPEQAWGRSVDGRSDIFSIGALLFEMLTGRRLFAGDSEMEVLEAVRECRVQAPGEVDPGVPEEVDAIVLEALGRTPDERFQTADELARRLEEILVAMRPSPGQAELASYMRELFHREVRPGPVPEPAGGPEQPPVPAPGDLEEAEEELSASGAVGRAAPRDAAASPTSTDAGGAAPAVEAVEPVAEVEPEEGGGRGKGLLVAAILAALLAAAVLYWFVSRPRPAGEGALEPPAALEESEEPGTAGSGAATAAPVEEASGGAAGSDPDSTAAAGPVEEASGGAAESDPDATAEGEPGAIPAGIEERLEEELSRREEELRREFETRQRELAERIEATETRASDEEADRDPAPDGAPDDEPAPSDPGAAPNDESDTSVPDRSDEKAGGSGGSAEREPAAGAEGPPPSGTATPASGSSAEGGAERVQAAGADRPASSVEEAGAEPAGAEEPARRSDDPGPEEASEEAPAPEPAPSVEVGDLVRMGPGVVPPKLVTFVKPEYPPIARRLRVEGTVILAVLVDENGDVVDARLEERVDQKVGINEAALDVAHRARYRPATKDGVRVKMWTTLKVPFRL